MNRIDYKLTNRYFGKSVDETIHADINWFATIGVILFGFFLFIAELIAPLITYSNVRNYHLSALNLIIVLLGFGLIIGGFVRIISYYNKVSLEKKADQKRT